MKKITVEVKGMMCAHCEAHTNEAIKRAMKVKSVESSSKEDKTVIIAKDFDEAKIRSAIEGAGYTVTGISAEDIESEDGFFKKLFSRK
jgi:Cu2+-exporting ATPase